MHQPISRRKVIQKFEPVDPNNPVMMEEEVIDSLNGNEIEEVHIQSFKYLPSGVPITKDMALFRDPVTGELTDMNATYVCTDCFARFALSNLGKILPDEQKILCNSCWEKERKKRRWRFVRRFFGLE